MRFGVERIKRMTYYGGKQLAASFRTVRGNTITIAEDIPENKYDFKATPDVRSVGYLSAVPWQSAQSISTAAATSP